MSESVVLAAADGTEATSKGRLEGATRRRPRTRFYVGMSSVLLLVVIAGFSRTFYLRSFFKVPTVPAYVLVHGVILTAWFAGLFFQAVLVSVRRTRLHRRLGWVVGGIGLAVVAISLAVTLTAVPRQRGLGVDVQGRVASLSWVVWTDLAALLTFSAFLAAGVLLRRQAEWHKRFMLLASISIISPAMNRMWKLVPALSALSSTSPTITSLTWGAFGLVLVGLALHDVSSSRRVHPATLLGGAAFVALRICAVVISDSELGRSFVLGLK